MSAEELSESVLDRKEQGWQFVQDADTLFVYIPVDSNGTIEFDAMLGNINTAPQSFAKFFKMLKKVGAKSVFSTYLNPQLTELIKSIKGYKPSFSNGDEIIMKVRL
jgi:hypothetical protein